MSDRKAELERKKARLEQMRKERQEKEQRRKQKDVRMCLSCSISLYPQLEYNGALVSSLISANVISSRSFCLMFESFDIIVM